MKIGRQAIVCVVVTLSLLPLLASTGHGQSSQWSFTRIADTGTPLPGGTATFTDFGRVSLSGRNVAFEGSGIYGQKGIYASLGQGLFRIADKTTQRPGGVGFITEPLFPKISGSSIVFVSADEGIYKYSAGTLEPVADRSTSIPGGSGPFTRFWWPSISGDEVAFIGHGTGSTLLGIYKSVGGTVSSVASLNTPVPPLNTESYSNLWDCALSGGNLAFRGAGAGSGKSGVYAHLKSAILRIADENTPIPDGTRNYRGLSVSAGFPTVAISGDNIAFEETDSSNGQSAIYAIIEGQPTTVVNTGTVIPGGNTTFRWVFAPSISQDSVFFVGMKDTRNGLYMYRGGTFSKIIAPGDQLDGRTVWSVSPWQSASRETVMYSHREFDGYVVAFSVDFSGGNKALYLASAIAGERPPREIEGNCKVSWAGDSFVPHSSPDRPPTTTVRVECKDVDPLAVVFSTEVYLDLLELRHPHEPRVADIEKMFLRMEPSERERAVSRAKLLGDYSKAVEAVARKAR